MFPIDPQDPVAGDAVPRPEAKVDRPLPIPSPGYPVSGEILSPAGGPSAPDAASLLRALRRRWVLASTVGLLVGAVAAGATWLFLPKAKDSANYKIQVTSHRFLGHDAGQGRGAEGVEKDLLAMVKSHVVLKSALTKVSPDVVRRLQGLNGDSVENLAAQVKAESIGRGMLSITVTGDNTEDLLPLAEAISKAFNDEVIVTQREEKKALLKDYEALRTARQNYLDQRTKDLELEAQKAGSASSEKLKSDRISLQMSFSTYRNQLDQVRKDVMLMKADLKAREVRLASPEELHEPADAIEKAIESDPALAKYRTERADLEKKLQDTIAVYDPANAENQEPVIRLRAKLKNLDELMEKHRSESRPRLAKELAEKEHFLLQLTAAELKDRIRLQESFQQSLEETVDELGKKLDGIAPDGPRQVNLEKYQALVAAARDGYAKVAAEINELEFDLNGKAAQQDFVVKDKGLTHGNDLKRRSIAAGGAGAGGFLLVLFSIAFIEFRARKIDSADEVSLGLGLPVVGTLPALPVRRSRFRAGRVDAYWRNRMNESVDAIRALLLHTARKEQLRVIMVTSAVGGEGKTSFSSHLAASFARAGRNSLLVDCDLRKPAVHLMFNLERGPGFSELLRGEVSQAEAIRPIQVDALSVITAGRCDATAIQALAQGGAGAIFQQLRSRYEFIIVDTAPALPVADSLLIGEHVDAVVFSILCNISRTPRVFAAYQRLGMVGIPILGAVVNGAREDVYYQHQNYAPVDR